MWLIDRLVEARIAEAAARGEFDNLPGAGRPHTLDDDHLVPEELRAAYRLLKNAGYVPSALAWRREIREIEQLLACVPAPDERSRAVRRLNYLLACLSGGELRGEARKYRGALASR